MRKQVKISGLRYSDKNEVISIKHSAENTRKIYRALCEISETISKVDFLERYEELLEKMENKYVKQQTPLRVSHRRANKVREKKVFKIEGNYIKSSIFEFKIEVQGGTYVKELIHGDEGRTTPSFAEIFKIPMECKELDVLKILQ